MVARVVSVNGFARTWYEHMLDHERRRLSLRDVRGDSLGTAMRGFERLYTEYVIGRRTPGEAIANFPELRAIWYGTTTGQYGHVRHGRRCVSRAEQAVCRQRGARCRRLAAQEPLTTLDDLRRFAAARSLFTPTTLKRALDRLGFVQADPIRAPARAQDLMLRHRVRNYRAGDLERRYPKLGVEEDFFLTYGFVTRAIHALMHPRPDVRVPAESSQPWPAARRRRAELLLAFVRERGAVHPRDVDDHFSHGTVKNYWGGSSNATTQLLDAMHYRGMLRVARREGGIRIYALHQHGPGPADPGARRRQLDALVDAAVRIYAPLPGASLSYFVRRLRFAVPQWHDELTGALERARQRLSHARVDGVDWYWPAGEDAARHATQGTVRLLAPFDPVVRDRARFELLWGWVYRFEAYTPAPKRQRGYYALPLLWRDRVIGWGNLSVKNGRLQAEFGYVQSPPPHDRAFKRELDMELDRMRGFLNVE